MEFPSKRALTEVPAQKNTGDCGLEKSILPEYWRRESSGEISTSVLEIADFPVFEEGV